MIKIIFYFFVFIIVSVNVFGQIVTISNQITFGGNAMDYPSFGRKTADNGYIIGGSSTSDISGDKTEYLRGQRDYWITKFDSYLNIVWQKAFGGIDVEMLSDIIITKDNGFLCIGTSSSPVSGDKTVANYNSSDDFWIIKLDSVGNIVWQKVFGGLQVDAAKSSIELNDKSILIAGSSSSDISGDKTENSQGYFDYWLLKIDSIGNILWDKTFGGSDYESLTNIAINSNSEIFLSGTSSSSISGDKSENSYGSNDIWIVKVDAQGNKIWDKTLGGNNWEDIGFLSLIDNSIFVLAQSSSDISGTKSENSKGLPDYWLTKLDNNGNIIWDKTIGGNNYEVPHSLTVTSDKHLLISGESWSDISGDKTEASKGIYDYWIVNVDTLRNLAWQKTIGGSDFESLFNTIEISMNNFLLVGYSKSGISGDKTDVNRGAEDFWLVEINNTVGISKIDKVFQSSVYPNPVEKKLYIQSTWSDKAYIEIIECIGKIVLQKELDGISNEINVENFSSGLYYYRIIEGQNIFETGKIIKE